MIRRLFHYLGMKPTKGECQCGHLECFHYVAALICAKLTCPCRRFIQAA